MKTSIIYNRDNLDILRGLNTNSIDLIYLDPPFNKKKTFTAPIGSSAEGASFRDIFRQEDVKDEWLKDIKEDHRELNIFLTSVKDFGGTYYLYNYCYLCYMSIRLIEMHRILKDTGSIYLHCDPHMSHYLKILMDIIFGEKNFRNELSWCYRGAGYPKKDFGKRHDIILRYSKTINYLFNLDNVREEYAEATKERFKHYIGNKRKTGDFGIQRLNPLGKHPDDWWQIQPISPSSKERTGYPTQKPLKLLERIIKASSNEGDIVLDPFCGCATTCVAAEKLKRKWIGIDISHKAYDLVKKRVIEETDLFTFYEEEKDYIKNKRIEEYIDYKTNPPIRTDQPKDFSERKYIYIISNKNYRRLKVGIAKDLSSRLNSYQTSDPNRAYKLEYNKLTHKYRALEKHIHKHFEAEHEWVDAPLEDIINEIELIEPKIKI